MSGNLLEVRDLHVSFRSKSSVLSGARVVRAVNGVDLDIAEGETLGLVGESGSGKSTLGRAILRLVDIDSGTISFAGRDIASMGRKDLRRTRRDMQMVFQDPYSSLDPSMIVSESVAEPLWVHEKQLDAAARHARVVELLELVGSSPHHAGRYPYEFSGGQRQRIAIARALALNPRLIICDEAVSALDVSTQNQVINLFEDLRERFGLSYLFIAHDLSVVRHISHRVAVMYLGKLVEIGETDRVYERAAHPYTEALLSAVPVPDPDTRHERHRIILRGDIPDPANAPSGCPFHTRCSYVMDICREVMPEMTPVDGGGTVACHLQTSGPELHGASLADVDVRPTTADGSLSSTQAGGPGAAVGSVSSRAAGEGT